MSSAKRTSRELSEHQHCSLRAVVCGYVMPVRPTAAESILVRERKATHIIRQRLPISSFSICISTFKFVLLAPENRPSVPLRVMNAIPASVQAPLGNPPACRGRRSGAARRVSAASAGGQASCPSAVPSPRVPCRLWPSRRPRGCACEQRLPDRLPPRSVVRRPLGELPAGLRLCG